MLRSEVLLMRMRDWELIANIYGEEWRELKWIEDYMVENGCDRAFVQKALSLPTFNLSKFRRYRSIFLEHSPTGDSLDWLTDNYMTMLELVEPCMEELHRLLDKPFVRLVNALARINWWLFVKWRLHYTLWSRDRNKEGRAWSAGGRTLSYWQLNQVNEHVRQLWVLNVEWTIPSWRSLDFSINVGGIENVVTFHIGLLLFSVFFQVEEFPQRWIRWLPEEERELSFSIHDGIIWIYLFAETDCWRTGDWRRIVIDPVDLLLGRERCITQSEGERSVDIDFDNRIYKAKAKLEIKTWTRSRLPFLKKRRKDVGLEIAGGIPIPGKGENSYDLDEDALLGTGASTTNFNTPWSELIAEAVQNAISSVQRTRRKYGGESWESLAQKVARETGLEIIDN
jgi:hypothetical protein